jgi:pimeloyl-ACP methyl ester carboxylesterase
VLHAARPLRDAYSGSIRINGFDLSYVMHGRGTRVVFVHGAISDHRLWEPQRAAIADYFL